jgi:hypothetical protein
MIFRVFRAFRENSVHEKLFRAFRVFRENSLHKKLFRVFRAFRENSLHEKLFRVFRAFREQLFSENSVREKIPTSRYSEELPLYGDLFQCPADPGSRIRFVEQLL